MANPTWISTSTKPADDQAVVVRYPDGSVDYQMWTRYGWLPGRGDDRPVAWRPLDWIHAGRNGRENAERPARQN